MAAKKDEDGAKGIFLDERKHLCVLVTTDRGLCGAVNSSLSRALRTGQALDGDEAALVSNLCARACFLGVTPSAAARHHADVGMAGFYRQPGEWLVPPPPVPDPVAAPPVAIVAGVVERPEAVPAHGQDSDRLLRN